MGWPSKHRVETDERPYTVLKQRPFNRLWFLESERNSVVTHQVCIRLQFQIWPALRVLQGNCGALLWWRTRYRRYPFWRVEAFPCSKFTNGPGGKKITGDHIFSVKRHDEHRFYLGLRNALFFGREAWLIISSVSKAELLSLAQNWSCIAAFWFSTRLCDIHLHNKQLNPSVAHRGLHRDTLLVCYPPLQSRSKRRPLRRFSHDTFKTDPVCFLDAEKREQHNTVSTN